MRLTKKIQKKIIITITVIALTAGVLLILNKKDDSILTVIESHTVTQELVQSSLTLSGRVEANSSRNLSFPVTGRIASMSVKTGDDVAQNQTLARLDNTLLIAQKREAEAELAIQEAVLDNLLAGNKPEEIAVKKELVGLAELAYAHLLSATKSLFFDSYNIADNAVRNVVDDYIENAQSTNPRLDFNLSRNQNLKLSMERDRVFIETTLRDWENLLSSDDSTLVTKETLTSIESFLTEIRDFMNQAALAINSADVDSDTTDTLLRTWKTNTANARTEVVSALSDLQNARRELETQEAKITQAQTELTLIQSGATATDIATQQQTISKSEARIQTINAEISERTLRAPIDGVIADVMQEVGETVSAGSSVLTIISEGLPVLNLETPELVLPQLQVGNRAQLIFLALSPHEPTFGTITTIDPQATIDNGLVPYYQVEVTLDETSLAVTPGLLAEAMIMVNDFPDSIAVPRRFLQDYDPTKAEASVWLETADGPQKQSVTVGQTLSDQRIIITGGLKEGDVIVRLDSPS